MRILPLRDDHRSVDYYLCHDIPLLARQREIEIERQQMNASVSAIMLRNSVKKASAVCGSLGISRTTAYSQAYATEGSQIFLKKNFSTFHGSKEQTADTSRVDPVPLPAVAYDYIIDYDEYEGDSSSTEKIKFSSSGDAGQYDVTRSKNILTPIGFKEISHSSTGRRISAPPISRPSGDQLPTSRRSAGGGGGGGTGRYRCPKCGTHVTFRHGDFDENTFYCATCSGWFLVTPNTVTAGDRSSNGEDFAPQNSSIEKRPELIMEHVRQKSKLRHHLSV